MTTWTGPDITLRAVTHRPDWFDDAACRGLDAEIFYPQQGKALDLARATCASCPVQPECAELAIANHELFGIWGGTSERQRRRIRYFRGVED